MSPPGGVTRDAGAASGAVTVVRVGEPDRASFLDAVGRALSFPAYYGHNLDALDECLRDLSWLPEGAVVLVWDDAPMRDQDPDTHRSVLELLTDASSDPAGAAAAHRPLTVVLAS